MAGVRWGLARRVVGALAAVATLASLAVGSVTAMAAPADPSLAGESASNAEAQPTNPSLTGEVAHSAGGVDPTSGTQSTSSAIDCTSTTPVRIGTPEQFMAFADCVNNNKNVSLNAMLTADIDLTGGAYAGFTGVGTRVWAYSGVFDGAGHTVTVNIDAPDTSNIGLFGRVGPDAQIRDVTVTGSVVGSRYVGGLIGEVSPYGRAGAAGEVVVERVRNMATVRGTRDVGGIVGSAYGNPSSPLRLMVQNCWNSGTVTSTGEDGVSAGIVMATVNDMIVLSVSGCLNTGSGMGNAIANYVYSGFLEKMTFERNYSSTVAPYEGQGAALTAGQLKSGEAAWLLNGEKSDGVWRQNLGGDDADVTPTLDSTHGVVHKRADGTFSNSQEKESGDFVVSPEDGGWSFVDGVLTFTGAGPYTVSMKPDAATTTNRIVADPGANGTVNLTIDGLNSAPSVGAPIGVAAKSTLNLTLTGSSTLRGPGDYIGSHSFPGVHVPDSSTLVISGTGEMIAVGGENCAGIGWCANGASGSVIVTSGTVTAKGGTQGAGIGTGQDGRVGSVVVSGGNVTAVGGTYGAGIGGGLSAPGGTVAVLGGVVTATGGSVAEGIGAGAGSEPQGSFVTSSQEGMPGNGVVFASSIGDQSQKEAWSGVIAEGNAGRVYGSPSPDSFEIPAGTTLTVPSGATLGLKSGVTIEDNGSIIVEDGAIVDAGGVFAGGGKFLWRMTPAESNIVVPSGWTSDDTDHNAGNALTEAARLPKGADTDAFERGGQRFEVSFADGWSGPALEYSSDEGKTWADTSEAKQSGSYRLRFSKSGVDSVYSTVFVVSEQSPDPEPGPDPDPGPTPDPGPEPGPEPESKPGPGGTTVPGGSTTNPDGSVTIPGGSTDKGEVTLPGGGGTVMVPGGSVVNPDGSVTVPGGAGDRVEITLPGGGTVVVPGGSVVNPDGTVTPPTLDAGPVVAPPAKGEVLRLHAGLDGFGFLKRQAKVGGRIDFTEPLATWGYRSREITRHPSKGRAWLSSVHYQGDEPGTHEFDVSYTMPSGGTIVVTYTAVVTGDDKPDDNKPGEGDNPGGNGGQGDKPGQDGAQGGQTGRPGQNGSGASASASGDKPTALSRTGASVSAIALAAFLLASAGVVLRVRRRI